MKKIVLIALTAIALMLAGSSPGDAFRGGGHGHFGHGGHVGVFIGGPVWDPWWWGPSYYPYYSAPPVIVQQQPETYIQQPPPAEEQSYWYFCREPEGYYPYVKKCPKGWMKVVPSQPPGEEEE